MAGDWKDIDDDKEKYAAYLCSREWAQKREAVRKRADGICECCRIIPMSACHHLTYARKYDEDLEDLQAICQPCHEFTHGKSKIDPASLDRSQKKFMRYLWYCKRQGNQPVPIDYASRLANLTDEYMEYVKAMRILCAADLEATANTLADSFPFAMPHTSLLDNLPFDPPTMDFMYRVCGFGANHGSEFLADKPEPEKDEDQ